MWLGNTVELKRPYSGDEVMDVPFDKMMKEHVKCDVYITKVKNQQQNDSLLNVDTHVA